MDVLFAGFVMSLICVGLFMFVINVAGFAYETILILAGKRTYRKFDIGGTLINYRCLNCGRYVNFWGNTHTDKTFPFVKENTGWRIYRNYDVDPLKYQGRYAEYVIGN